MPTAKAQFAIPKSAIDQISDEERVNFLIRFQHWRETFGMFLTILSDDNLESFGYEGDSHSIDFAILWVSGYFAALGFDNLNEKRRV